MLMQYNGTPYNGTPYNGTPYNGTPDQRDFWLIFYKTKLWHSKDRPLKLGCTKKVEVFCFDSHVAKLL